MTWHIQPRKLIVSSLLLLLLILVGGAGLIYYYLYTPAFSITQTAYIYIDRDDTPDSVFWKIEQVAQPKSNQLMGLRFLAERDRYGEHLHTGRYAIQPTDPVRVLYRRLSRGYQTPVNLTLPSVRTLDRLARAVGRQLMIDSLDLARLFNDSGYCQKLGYTPATLPALFIPNTYEVYWNLSAESFIQRMVKEHAAFWNEKRKQKAAQLNMTPNEVATLASIVEEETAYGPEKPIVAGLYLNRLRRGMLLQADPTVKFALQDFGLKRILFKHLKVDSPYNTYKHVGLPPGPIRIPSIQGLESVLNYTPHHYLYMCAREDFSGTHNFATNLWQHAANARRYQQALNRRKIK